MWNEVGGGKSWTTWVKNDYEIWREREYEYEIIEKLKKTKKEDLDWSTEQWTYTTKNDDDDDYTRYGA